MRQTMRHALIIAGLSIWRIGIGMRIVGPLRIADLLRTRLSLPTLFLDGHVGIELPHVSFSFLVTLGKGIVLAKVVTHTRLPSACRSSELVEGICSLNVVVYLL